MRRSSRLGSVERWRQRPRTSLTMQRALIHWGPGASAASWQLGEGALGRQWHRRAHLSSLGRAGSVQLPKPVMEHWHACGIHWLQPHWQQQQGLGVAHAEPAGARPVKRSMPADPAPVPAARRRTRRPRCACRCKPQAAQRTAAEGGSMSPCTQCPLLEQMLAWRLPSCSLTRRCACWPC